MTLKRFILFCVFSFSTVFIFGACSTKTEDPASIPGISSASAQANLSVDPLNQQGQASAAISSPLVKPNETYTEANQRLFDIWYREGQHLKTERSSARPIVYNFSYYRCANGVDCREKYVRLYFNSGATSGECEGSIIGENLVLTNAHCAEVIFSAMPGSQSRGNGYVIIPESEENRGDFVIADMMGLVSISQPYNVLGIKSDFAIIRTGPWSVLRGGASFRPTPVKISREGLKNGKTYYVYSSSPFGDDSREIQKRPCRSVHNNIFHPTFDSEGDATFLLSDCPIGPGNSGSPLYNEQGELVGLIGGQLNPRLILALGAVADETFGMLQNNNLFEFIGVNKKRIGHVGWGNSLACIPLFHKPEYSLPESCNRDFKEPKISVDLPAGAEDILKTKLSRFASASDFFRFKTVRGNDPRLKAQALTQLLFLRAPECIFAEKLDGLDQPKVIITTPVTGLKTGYLGEVTSTEIPLRQMEAEVELVELEELKKTRSGFYVLNIKEISVYIGKIEVCN